METEDNIPAKGEGSDHDSMKTLASCTNMLYKQGYKAQFKALHSGIQSLDTDVVYLPQDVKIDNFYRFEGESDPSDNSILYAIETSSGEKGTLTDGYGMYYNAKISEFIKEVEEIHKQAHEPKPGEEGNQSSAS